MDPAATAGSQHVQGQWHNSALWEICCIYSRLDLTILIKHDVNIVWLYIFTLTNPIVAHKAALIPTDNYTCAFRENTPGPIILRTNPRWVTERVIMNVCSPWPACTGVFIHVGVQFRLPTWLHPKWSPFLGHIVIQKPDWAQQYARMWI